MKCRYARTCLLLLLAFAGRNALAATNTANLHLFDRHVFIERGAARLLGQVIAEIEFSSILDFEPANGEFVCFEDAPPGAGHATITLPTPTAATAFWRLVVVP